MGDEQLATLVERLRRIEDTLALLVAQRTVKDWYTTAEVAGLLGKAEFTVREWCRRGRIRADKRSVRPRPLPGMDHRPRRAGAVPQ